MMATPPPVQPYVHSQQPSQHKQDQVKGVAYRIWAKMETEYVLPGGAATCSEDFVKCFLRVPRLLGCTAAAMLPKARKGNF